MKTPHWLNTSEYPFESRFLIIDGHCMHYIDEGEGETVLFVHGTPSWSFDFRHLIKKLKNKYRCVALDHIGFGLSDKPKNYSYTAQQHARNLEVFIQRLGLKPITLVVHDFGGPIGLSYALKYPEHIRRIVILNSWMWRSDGDPHFIKLKRVLKSPVIPFLYRYLNVSPRFVLPASFGKKKLSKTMRRQYTSPFTRASEREGVVGFVWSLLNEQEWFESLWQQREELQHVPVLLIWGLLDPVIPPAYLDRFVSGFPKAESKRLESCGHFPQEEEHEAVTESLLQFLTQTK